MSDGRIRAAIEQMEAWVTDLTWEPDAEELDQWNTDFLAALAEADKAGGWPDLVRRAHAASQVLDARISVAVETRDQIRAELEAQERGARALRGYGATVR